MSQVKAVPLRPAFAPSALASSDTWLRIVKQPVFHFSTVTRCVLVASVASKRCPVMRIVCSARCGLAPLTAKFYSAARVCVIGSAVVASGCAANQSPNYAGAYNSPVQPVNERQWKVEIEEDGKPAQLPPVRRMRPEEDDPTQPWSPNYGRGAGSILPSPVPSEPRIVWPKPIETSVRIAPSSRPLAEAEADALIARAVNAHEIRRP